MVCSIQRDILTKVLNRSKEIGQWVIDNNNIIDKNSKYFVETEDCLFAGWTKYTKNKMLGM